MKLPVLGYISSIGSVVAGLELRDTRITIVADEVEVAVKSKLGFAKNNVQIDGIRFDEPFSTDSGKRSSYRIFSRVEQSFLG